MLEELTKQQGEGDSPKVIKYKEGPPLLALEGQWKEMMLPELRV